MKSIPCLFVTLVFTFPAFAQNLDDAVFATKKDEILEILLKDRIEQQNATRGVKLSPHVKPEKPVDDSANNSTEVRIAVKYENGKILAPEGSPIEELGKALADLKMAGARLQISGHVVTNSNTPALEQEVNISRKARQYLFDNHDVVVQGIDLAPPKPNSIEETKLEDNQPIQWLKVLLVTN